LGIPTRDEESPFDSTPSFEDQSELIAAQQLVIEQLTSQVAELRATIADLTERLGRTPRNSAMPPSAEGLSKPPSRAERRAAAKRKPGKQPGTEGKHLAQVVAPDAFVIHVPDACGSCGADLACAPVVDTERRQVFDLPEIAFVVTEHVAERRRCACGSKTKASFPKAATAPAVYGPGVRALAAYLSVHQHLPLDRTAQLFCDLLGQEVSVGAIASMITEAAAGTTEFTEHVRVLLRQADTVHFDETGARVNGRLSWVHGASNEWLTLLDCHDRRGKVAMGELGVIAHMSGVAVHDGWRPYRSFDVTHALCNAHHLRELEGVGVVWNQGWANDLADLLGEAKTTVDEAIDNEQTSLDDTTLHSIRVRYGMLVAKGFAANPAPPDGVKRHGYEKKAYNLLVRLDTQRADVLRFCHDFRAPFTNNQAERDIRLVKLQQKISGSWRTMAGARNFCAIRSYISTMRKNGRDVLGGLRLLFEGQVWLPGVSDT
jgi:transposase